MTAPTTGSTGAAALKRRRPRRLALIGAVALPLVLGGCQLPTFWGYRGSTTQAHDEFTLWSGTFIAAIGVGAITGSLIIWSIIRYRRRGDQVPRQFQQHTGLEIAYTVIPIIIVLVLFGFTVVTENAVDDIAPHPAVGIDVNAFQWGWQFTYKGRGVSVEGETLNDPDPVGLNGAACAPTDRCLGPGLIVPAGKTVRIYLRSKDTIHGFYVPQFNFSRYAQPGVLNKFDLTVVHPGIYRAQCTQFCGLYHSEMFFHVVALPPAQFQQWLTSQQTVTTDGFRTASNSLPANITTAMVTPHEFLQVGSETNGRYRGPQVTGGIPLFAPFGTGYYQNFGLAGGPSPHYTGPVFAPVVHKGAIALTSATTGGPHPSTSHREAAA